MNVRTLSTKDSDENTVLMIMPFIEGHPINRPNDHQLTQLAKSVRTLHRYSGSYPTRYTFKNRLEQHYQKGTKSGIAYPTGFDQQVQAILKEPCSRSHVPCHGDLNPSNILVDDLSDTLSIVDWTTATMEDPLADLAYFCLLSNLSPAQETVFLEAYYARALSEKEYQTFKEEKAKVCLLTATLWLRYSETPEERNLPFESRISALDAELRSSSLKTVQDYLQEGTVVDLHTAPKPAVRSYGLSFYKAYLEAQISLPDCGIGQKRL